MVLFFFVLVEILLFGGQSLAWTVGSEYTNPCHEDFSAEAMSEAGYIKPPPELSRKDRQLYENVTFDPSPYNPNIYMLSLLIGCRWNDLRGESTFEIWNLLETMSDPEDSGEHCLRLPSDNWESGEVEAIERCKESLRSFARKAWSYSSGDGQPDPDIRVEVPVFLLYTGKTDVELSGFYYYAGRAMHTIADSFAHNFRTEDRMQIVEVVNGTEEMVGRDFDPRRDGPGHLTVMDDCMCHRPMIEETTSAVIEASSEYLRILYSDPAVRGEDLEIFLERWFSHVPNCTLDNDYCSSPDPVSYREAKCAACNCLVMVPGKDENRAGLAYAVAAILALLGLAWRKRKLSAGACIILVALLFLFLSQQAEAKGKSEEDASKRYLCIEMPPPEKDGPFAAFRVGASLWRPGMAIQVSAGWVWKRWNFSYVADWNPWIGLERTDFAPGVYSTGVGLAYVLPVNPVLKMRFEMVQGVGVLLFSPYGHHKGEIGPWSAYRIVGLDIRTSRRIVLMIDPVDMTVIVINPVKLPLLYQQWRLSVGIKFK